MRDKKRKLLVLIGLGLLGSLIGCSNEGTAPQDTEITYTADQIEFINPMEISKDLPTAGGSRFGGGSGEPAVFFPWMPDAVRFMLNPGENTSIDQNYFKFRAMGDAVEQPTLIQGIWLGPRGIWGYDMSPHGMNFNSPVQFMIDVSPLLALDLPQDRLLMLHDNEDGTFVPVQAEIVPYDSAENNSRYFMRGTLNHFSKYVIGIGPPPGGQGDN